MADNYKSGVHATVTINGTEVPITSWAVDPTAEIVRFRNSKLNANTKKESTFKDVTIAVEMDFDFDGSPFASPISLAEGSKVTNLKCWCEGGGSGGSGAFWLFPSAIVVGTPMRAEIEGKITISANFENDGVYTRPAV